MIAVIADDITGAAEIAGIGLRFDMQVSMVTDLSGRIPPGDLLVYATDTRSMSESDAVAETRRVVRQLSSSGASELFKKTDSALRGHVVPELETIMREAGFEQTLYLPENPSKGRVIREGIYYVHDVPLDQTFFAEDPEFPATTADVKERLGRVAVIQPSEWPGSAGIYVANATDAADVAQWVSKRGAKTLLAGGADFFTAYLASKGWKVKEAPAFGGLGEHNLILVCGSTAGQSLEGLNYFRRKTVQVETMPQRIFEGKERPEGWYRELCGSYELHRSIAIGVGHPPKGGAKFARRLRNTMAEATACLIDTRLPHELIIEGGATAFAVLRRLGWHHFRMTEEIAPGVVRMSLAENPEIHLILKPGSYAWGERIFQ